MPQGFRSEQGDVLYGSFNDLSEYTPLEVTPDWTGTSVNPVTVFSAKGGYIKTYTVGSDHSAAYQRMNGSMDTGTGINGTTKNKIYIFCLSYDTGYTYVYQVFADNASEAKTAVQNGTQTQSANILYRNKTAVAEGSLITDIGDWDEEPTPDGADPFGSFGGGGADRQDFGVNDNFLASDLEADLPEGNDYGAFVTPYELTTANMQAVGSNLFKNNFWSNLSNKFSGLSDPLSMILSAVELPVSNSNYATNATFKLGGVPVEDDDGFYITVSKLTRRYDIYSCGAITLKETWGSGKDYSDTSIDIYLPFVGMRELDPHVVIGTKITLYARLDRWTGDILYQLHVDNATVGGKYYRQAGVVYRFGGNCGIKVPMGRVDNSAAVTNLVGSVAGLALGMATGNPLGAAAGVAAGVSGAQNILSRGFTPTVHSSGGISGPTGIMDQMKPYLIIKRSVPHYPADWRTHIGAPNYQMFTISDLSGFTLFSELHLENMTGASKEEIDELTRELMTEGIIL